MNRKPLTYKEAGVDISRGQEAVRRIKPLAARTMRPEVVAGIGGFAGGFRFGDATLLTGADGVGSKVLISQKLQRHDTVGIDLVAMNVNDILAAGGEPLFFLDYIAVNFLDPALIEELVSGVVEGCLQAECVLIGGETAEMPDLYQPGHYDLAGFVVGKEMITIESCKEGDHVIGLASTGFHSNGYALVRAVVERAQLDWNGTYAELGGETLGDVLLRPTKIYVKPVSSLWPRVTVRGMAHITGGGLVENLPRALPRTLGATLSRDHWPLPPVFSWLQTLGDIPDTDMYRTFNMGIGFTVIVDKDDVDATLAHFQSAGLAAFDIGLVHQGSGVTIV